MLNDERRGAIHSHCTLLQEGEKGERSPVFSDGPLRKAARVDGVPLQLTPLGDACVRATGRCWVAHATYIGRRDRVGGVHN